MTTDFLVTTVNNIRSFKTWTPKFGSKCWIDPSAQVIGNVTLGDDCSVWPTAVIRGDMHAITIGNRTSIQDASVLHITHASDYNPDGHPLNIGDDVTLGHRVLLHGCTLGNRILVGMDSVIMDGTVVEDDVIIGAGSLVPGGKVLESGYLYMGRPAKTVRPLKDSEFHYLKYTAGNYVKLKNEYLEES
ncbi:gamma carbonic anhydrase family protein [Litoribrevibacter albus]|uniref:Gamma carbonic anhydrase family protein n=1 Tax=Litoribrevibacter albus TaxID=1473156 RepID=A0AA37SEI4_9GAMM|nr:gamma carbonic anhydrase family protein [Litoribrevibacter albus]GLQ32942.1 gamma carbonic anhydrase family protein [Litoribrevibacter albus]